MSKGSLISFLDDDDWVTEDKLSLQVRSLIDNPDCSISVCALMIKNKEETRIVKFKFPLNNQYDYFLNNLKSNFGLPLCLIKKSAFLECGGLDNSFKALQDLDFNLRFFKIGKICLVEKPLIIVNTSDDDRISRNFKNKIDSVKRVMKKYEKILVLNSYKFFYHSILQMSYAIGDKSSFDEAFKFFQSNNSLKFKYVAMKYSWRIIYARRILTKIINY